MSEARTMEDRCQKCEHYVHPDNEYDWCHFCAMEADCFRPIAEEEDTDVDGWMLDYEVCYECRGYCDDYYLDGEGEWQSSCDTCPFGGNYEE